jgi:hypothetical protein
MTDISPREPTWRTFFLLTFFVGPLCNITKAQARVVRPVGLSDEQWQATLNFEKDCRACRSCHEESYGFGERLKERYNPTYAVGTAGPEYFLHIVIGTVPRRASDMVTNYLTQQLDSVEHQLELPGTHLTTFNHRPGAHAEFSQLQHKYQDSSFISMHDLKANTCDPVRPTGWSFHAGLSPMLRARQQTRDVLNMLLEVRDTSRFILLVEDDFIFCPQALTLMYHKLLFAQEHVQFSAMRFGVGMSGILLKAADIPSFTHYLAETQHNMPIDLLATEWFLAAMPITKYKFNSGRQFIINKETLVSHIGDVTSFQDKRGIRKSALCGERVRVRSYFEQKESYQVACDNVELSPCSNFKQPHVLKVHVHGAIQPDTIPRTVRVVMAPAGQHCEAGCNSLGQHDGFDQCFNVEMPKLNSCGLVKRYLPQCTACIVEEGVGAQAHGSDESGYVCVVPTSKTSSLLRNCKTNPKNSEWRQICLCKSTRAVQENGDIMAEKG